MKYHYHIFSWLNPLSSSIFAIIIFKLLYVVGFKISGAVKVEVCGQQPTAVADTYTAHCTLHNTVHLNSTTAYSMHLLIWPVLWATVFFKLLSAPSVCSSSPWVVELVLWSIQRLQLTSERVILCSSLFTVHCSVQCSVRGIKRVHLTSAQPCSHGNLEQVQDTQLFQSLIMPILATHLPLIIIIIIIIIITIILIVITVTLSALSSEHDILLWICLASFNFWMWISSSLIQTQQEETTYTFNIIMLLLVF